MTCCPARTWPRVRSRISRSRGSVRRGRPVPGHRRSTAVYLLVPECDDGVDASGTKRGYVARDHVLHVAAAQPGALAVTRSWWRCATTCQSSPGITGASGPSPSPSGIWFPRVCSANPSHRLKSEVEVVELLHRGQATGAHGGLQRQLFRSASHTRESRWRLGGKVQSPDPFENVLELVRHECLAWLTGGTDSFARTTPLEPIPIRVTACAKVRGKVEARGRGLIRAALEV